VFCVASMERRPWQVVPSDLGWNTVVRRRLQSWEAWKGGGFWPVSDCQIFHRRMTHASLSYISIYFDSFVNSSVGSWGDVSTKNFPWPSIDFGYGSKKKSQPKLDDWPLKVINNLLLRDFWTSNILQSSASSSLVPLFQNEWKIHLWDLPSFPL
jgi:hypothetical protein